ncbi:MAG: hypothetical protein LC126_26325 [Bryobacterales bacterium]|nr:hypothetical protein [Bryobacterales bacterium]
MPDVSLVVAAMVLFYGLFFGDGAGKLFRDSDTGWHIRTGESLLKGNPLPRTDPYSFTMAGKPWFAWEWGSDVLLGAAHRWDGLRGVAVLISAAAAFSVWVWFHLHWKVGGNFFLACAMAAPMLTTMSMHWLARPHVFSWLLSLAAVLSLEHTSARIGWRTGLAWFAAGALWANLHASFFFLPCLCFLYALGSGAREWIWAEQPEYPSRFLLLAGFSAAGTLANPYGWRLHQHVFAYLTNTELLARIGEFQTFNFHLEGAWQILLTVIVALVALPLLLARRRVEHFLLACGVAAIALRSARALPLAALLVLPLANGAITEALEHLDVRHRLRQWLDRFLSYSGRVRLLDRRCGGYALTPLVFVLAVGLLRTPAFSRLVDFPPKEFPVAAAAAVETLPEDARLLAPDKYGGYLIYRFGGKRKVFFDGRSDFYGVAFMKDYIRLIEARPGWPALVERFGFTHALLPGNYSLLAALEQSGWHGIYKDDTATLLRNPLAQRSLTGRRVREVLPVPPGRRALCELSRK